MRNDFVKVMELSKVAATTSTDSGAIVASRNESQFLHIYSILAYANTSTANQTIQFGNTSTGDKVGLRDFATKGDILDIKFPIAWQLNTNTSLFVYLATTGSVHCTVNYEVGR